MKADRYLPKTGMIDGRRGKPRSHRWYKVLDVPPDMGPRDMQAAGGIGGPGTRLLRHPDKRVLVEFRGTGSQVVAPPSVWTSKVGTLQEGREWDVFDEPAVVDCRELFEAAQALAAACGHVVSAKAEPEPGQAIARPAPPTLPIPAGEVFRQARCYVARMKAAVSGRGGNSQTYRVACVLVVDFGLSPDEALPLLLEYNLRCSPPWTVRELYDKLLLADGSDRPRGGKVRSPRRRRVLVSVRPRDREVLVGVACAGRAPSYVDLTPSLGEALVDMGGGVRALIPELAAVAWKGREVTLAPASTVATNQQDVWSEFFLAKALRDAGATVKTLRLPPLNGRKRTMADLAGAEVEVVDPPFHPWDAKAKADEAGQKARELDSYRKSLPRNKPSPKLEQGLAFLRENGAQNLTKAILSKAKEKGISKGTLRRALQQHKSSLTTSTPNT